ncbi:MAG: peroxiredoxin [Hyphomicrobiaceae bacterium]
MTIRVGDKLPAATFTVMGADGPAPASTADVFDGKKVVLFAVPGAYTPTCHKGHMPGFVRDVDAIKAKGVDTVACTSVNDVFVMDAWAKDSGAKGKIEMLADGSADFVQKLGLEIDLTARGLGLRSNRYAMLVDDGVVKILNVEAAPPNHESSSAAHMLSQIGE